MRELQLICSSDHRAFFHTLISLRPKSDMHSVGESAATGRCTGGKHSSNIQSTVFHRRTKSLAGYRTHGLSFEFSNLKLYRFSIEVWNAFCSIDRSRHVVSMRKKTLLFNGQPIVDLRRRPRKPDHLVVWSTKIQRTNLGTLTNFAWIADRFGDGGLASRFLQKAGAFVHWEKTSSYPFFTSAFLHRDLNSL